MDANTEFQEITLENDTSNKSLVGWKNAPSLMNLKRDLQDAKPAHDFHVSQINGWLDNLHVRNKAQVDTPEGNSRIVPKLIRKQAEWRYPALTEPFLSTDDLFNAKPVTWEDREAARQNQLVLNKQFNVDIDKIKFIDDYIRTAVDEGTVIVRLGWDFEEEEYEVDVPEVEYRVNPEFAPMHQQLDQMEQESPSQYDTDVPDEVKQAHQLYKDNGVPIEPVVLGRKMQKVMKTIRNCPTVEVCDYHNVYIDPTCLGNIKKARFIIYSFETDMSRLKKDGKYKNLDKVSIDNNTILTSPYHASTPDNRYNFNFTDQPRKKFIVYEYWGFWDIDGSGVVKPIVVSWVGNTIIRMEENPFPDKALPFVVVPYLPIRRSAYGEPDGALLEDNQKITGAVTRGMIDILGKSANGQTGIRKDALDATNRRKFLKGQDYEFNANVDPRQAIFMHTYPEIPQSAQFMLQLQQMEAESLTGVKAFNQGISGQSLGDVAAGVRGALDASSKRELAILRRLSAGIVEIGHKIISMNSEFLSDKEVIRITNDEFVTVHRKDLVGRFDLQLSISTAEEDNNKAQELAFMLQTMGNNMDPEMSRMILADIARLRKMPDLAHKIEKYQPQPDPLMQRKQQLEVALLEAQLENEKAEAQLKLAKASTEGVKASNVQSDTDLKNLEFVEQESGVKQERDLQKISRQAESQTQLKAIDAGIQDNKHKHDVLKEFIKASNSKTE